MLIHYRRPLIALAILVGLSAPAAAQNYCTAADPNDNVADNVELQNCLDSGGTILLTHGSPGYILEAGLRLRVSGTVLSSANVADRTVMIARSSLNEFMMHADADYYEIGYLVFDGNRSNRTNSCNYPNGHNILAYGTGFTIRYIDSINARCGSSLEVAGTGFDIYNNTFAWNGFSADERSSEFADGMTIHRCIGGSVRDNQFAENTDVNLVVNEGTNCVIRWNTIWNYDRYAFAGIHVSAGFSGGDHSGSDYSNNTVSSGYDKMGFGIIVGAETWHGTRTAYAPVWYNDISGAVINLAVDGVDGGNVTNNTMSNAQGTRGFLACNGQSADNFIAAHNGSGLTLQAGATNRTCHY